MAIFNNSYVKLPEGTPNGGSAWCKNTIKKHDMSENVLEYLVRNCRWTGADVGRSNFTAYDAAS